jgi:hypothetical protein
MSPVSRKIDVPHLDSDCASMPGSMSFGNLFPGAEPKNQSAIAQTAITLKLVCGAATDTSMPSLLLVQFYYFDRSPPDTAGSPRTGFTNVAPVSSMQTSIIQVDGA